MSFRQLIWDDILNTYQIALNDRTGYRATESIHGMLALTPLLQDRLSPLIKPHISGLTLILYSSKTPKKLKIDAEPNQIYHIRLLDGEGVLEQTETVPFDQLMERLQSLLEYLYYSPRNLNFAFETDYDTQILYETIAHFLTHFFDHSEDDALRMINEYIPKWRDYRDDDFYYHRGEYESAIRIHYAIDLGLDENFYQEWAIKNDFWHHVPPYAKAYIHDLYF